MTGKAKGGRGKKAKNPYERFTVTVPPELRVWLDGEAQRQGVTRSEALTLLLAQARSSKTSMSGKSAAPAVLPGTPELFPLPKAEQTKKTVSTAKNPKTPKSAAPAAPRAAGPAATPSHVDRMLIAGSKLSTAQALICAGLKLPGAVAEYDSYERRWMVGFAGAPAREADLEELARLGVLEVTGEGRSAVYRLAEHSQSKTTAQDASRKRGRPRKEGPRARPKSAAATEPMPKGQHQGEVLKPVPYRLARLPRRDLLSDMQRHVVELLEAGGVLHQEGEGQAYFVVSGQGVALKVHAGTVKMMMRTGILRSQDGGDSVR